MPAGAKPGERRGGRAKGTPNKKTMEAARLAARETEESRIAKRPLGKERLRELMEIFIGAAVYFRPQLRENEAVNPRANWQEFKEWGRLAMDCAAKLAPYESPTFKAVVVAEANQVEIDANIDDARRKLGKLLDLKINGNGNGSDYIDADSESAEPQSIN